MTNVVHIEVGRPDWEPTKKELEQIAEMFQLAYMDAGRKVSVLATTRGFTVRDPSIIKHTVKKTPTRKPRVKK